MVPFEELLPDGIFITHAHIGHYTGLMHLGREALGGSGVPVYAMPEMQRFLRSNGPWSQLVASRNIELRMIVADSGIVISRSLMVTPFLVPHRDEYSETVGFTIKGPNRTALFIPDINKWSVWERDIKKEIAKVDVALIDATFFNDDELPGRDMSEIPHPFVVESMALFSELPLKEKQKVVFIHFNHTNSLLVEGSAEQRLVEQAGFRVARRLQRIGL